MNEDPKKSGKRTLESKEIWIVKTHQKNPIKIAQFKKMNSSLRNIRE